MALHRLPHRLLLGADASTTAPGNVNRTKASYGTDPNFDTNMVIILAALLCALICALGLNSMVHCALRCSRRFASETPGDAAASRLAATKGLKKSALNKIPILVYGSGSDIAATDCAICLGEFVNGEKIRVLPKCKHGFHVRCIDTWLLAHSSCPTCRQSLLEQPTISEARAVVVAAPAPAPAHTDAGTRSHVENASGGHEHLPVAVVVHEVV